MTELATYGQSRLSREVDAFWRDMRLAFPDRQRAAFERLMADPGYAARYQKGYEDGRRDGARQAFAAYLRSIRDLAAVLLQGLDPRIALPLVTGAIRVYSDPVGTPVPRELRDRFAAARWYTLLEHAVQRAAPDLDRLNRMSVVDGLDWVAGAVVAAMRKAGSAWVREFYALNGRPEQQGRHAGRLIGSASAQVLIAALEEITTAGIGRLLDGTGAAKRIGEIADAERARIGPRPARLEEAIAEAARERGSRRASAGAGAALAEAADLADEVARFVDRLKDRLGDRLVKFADLIDNGDWVTLTSRARALKNAKDEVAARMLKGDIAEVIYPKTPDFARLFDELAQRAARDAQWGELLFERAPRAHHLDGSELVTDGVLYAVSSGPGPKRVWVLAVFESKSPSNARHIAQWPKDSGDARWWAGQFTDDLERLQETAITLGGERYQPGQLVVSRKPPGTEWVTVTAKDVHLSRTSIGDLKAQGFLPQTWNLPVTDDDLNRLAAEIIRLVR